MTSYILMTLVAYLFIYPAFKVLVVIERRLFTKIGLDGSGRCIGTLPEESPTQPRA